MGKAAAFCLVIALIFSIFVLDDARTLPVEKPGSVQGFDEEKAELSCDGVGEEECLMRRTLAAHIDYIYTQEKTHN